MKINAHYIHSAPHNLTDNSVTLLWVITLEPGA